LDRAIFLPVAALVALTFGVALLLLRARATWSIYWKCRCCSTWPA
jgi:hypothetical protein